MTESWGRSLEDHRSRQRRTIYDATLALVAERGVSEVSMTDVARRAGIGRATLYKYFPSVEHVLAAMTLEEIRRERAALDRALDGVEDPLARIEVSVRFLMGYFGTRRHREAAAVVSPYQLSPEAAREVTGALEELRGMLADMVHRAVERGALRPGPGAGFTAAALHHLLAAGREAVVEGGTDPDEAADRVMAVFLDGTRAR